jgi:hypothetical protein
VPKIKVTFEEVVQVSQEFGSDNEYMVSRVFFTAEIGEWKSERLSVDIKQTVGADYLTGPIEVLGLPGVEGLSYSEFRDAAEAYFRSWVGGVGGQKSFLSLGASAQMDDNRYVMKRAVEFEPTKG